MDIFVATLNIEHLRDALAKEQVEAKRQTLVRLLANEEVKLASAQQKQKAAAKAG